MGEASSEIERLEMGGGCVKGGLGDVGDLFVGGDWVPCEGDGVRSGAGHWAWEGESAAISLARAEEDDMMVGTKT